MNLFVWFFVFAPQKPTLKVSFLNVGQGDSIFIESPGGFQMLIDGGRDRSVLRELSKRMSPLDRTIDLVVETHPDADHIGGLPGVFDHYRVSHFMHGGVANDTTPTEALSAAIRDEGVETILARRGMRLHLGREVYADILFPDRDVSGLETNTGSVSMKVVYGSTEFMLTGDAPSSIEEWLVTLDGKTLESDVLKAGHHGSKNSSDALWLSTVAPEVVVISASKSNSYGHPHEETLARIEDAGAAVRSTADGMAVRFVSDGEVIREQ